MVFQRNYKAWYGEELNVPRWNDIIDKYDLITDKKREKERERLEVVTAQKEKIEARVLKYQQGKGGTELSKSYGFIRVCIKESC